jgi:hypothetical protein
LGDFSFNPRIDRFTLSARFGDKSSQWPRNVQLSLAISTRNRHGNGVMPRCRNAEIKIVTHEIRSTIIQSKMKRDSGLNPRLGLLHAEEQSIRAGMRWNSQVCRETESQLRFD